MIVQNKPNFPKKQNDVTLALTSTYKNETSFRLRKNKPNLNASHERQSTNNERFCKKLNFQYVNKVLIPKEGGFLGGKGGNRGKTGDFREKSGKKVVVTCPV